MGHWTDNTMAVCACLHLHVRLPRLTHSESPCTHLLKPPPPTTMRYL
jgi:hypothetical protein